MPAEVRPADPELRHNMLGMTEAGSVCLAGDDESEQPEHRRGSFGRPVPGFEIGSRVDGACAAGRVGELCFRGPFLMEGYDGRERHETFDADGWYHTGDLVTVDDDGFVYFRGRSGDMIKTAGANVSPREVEAAILEVTGLVAHVVGIDDAARGQIVAALIRAPAAGEGDVDLDDLQARLREPALGLQGAAVGGGRPRSRGPDDVERQGRPAGAQGDPGPGWDVAVSRDAETVPGLLAMRRASDGDRQAIVTAEDAASYARARRSQRGAARRGWSRRAW